MTRLVAAVAMFASACSTTTTVKRPFASDELSKVNEILERQTATIVHDATPRRDRQSDIATDISLVPPAARWTVWESGFARDRGTPPGQPVEAPIDAVRKITLCDSSCRTKGALEGAGVGLLAGVILGVIAANHCNPDATPCGFQIFTIPLLTMPLTTLIGYGFGHRTNIEFGPVDKR